MFKKAFWKGAAERAIKTFAQTLGAGLILGVGVLDVDWVVALSLAATATLASLLTSVGSPEFVAGKPDVVTIENTHG